MIANDIQTQVSAQHNQRGKVRMTGIPEDFVHLDGFLLPAEFWLAFGYEGQARFVGTFWTPFGDEAIYTDGQVEADGNWQAYLMLVDHPTNAELLRYPCWLCQGRGATNDLRNESCDECDGMGVLEYNLGSSDLQATHILIADRMEEEVYVAPVLAGSQFLHEQWPPPPLLTATAADAIVEALRQAVSEMGMPDPEEVERAMQEVQERLRALRQALYPDLAPGSCQGSLRWQQEIRLTIH